MSNRQCSLIGEIISSVAYFSHFQAITPAGSYFLCGSFTAVAVLYVGMFVPETKGKTQEEMKQYFQGKRREERKGLE